MKPERPLGDGDLVAEGHGYTTTKTICPVKSGRRAMADRWLSVAEIADHLGVKRDTVYKWIERKEMPAQKVGRLWKFRRDEVDAWIRSGKASEGPPRAR